MKAAVGASSLGLRTKTFSCQPQTDTEQPTEMVTKSHSEMTDRVSRNHPPKHSSRLRAAEASRFHPETTKSQKCQSLKQTPKRKWTMNMLKYPDKKETSLSIYLSTYLSIRTFLVPLIGDIWSLIVGT